ncbi:MAG: EmrB/QacA subfamily drug resistance transporter [Candidatus Poriferisodalaceae bacterium]
MNIEPEAHQETTQAPESPWPIFAVCVMAFFVIMFDLAVVNVAFPDILTDLGIATADGSWIVSLYNILFGSLLVVAGKSADIVGRRRIFQIGVAAFGLGSLLAGLAPNLAMLLGGRAIQGIGAAIMLPAALGLMVAAFPIERRTQIMAYWGAVGAFGVMCGPSFGAGVIQVTNWRAAFFIPLALCVALLVGSSRVLKKFPVSKPSHRPDYPGAALVTASLASLVLGVSRSGSWGWTNPATITVIAAGLVGLAAFVQRQRSHPEPILDLTLFRSRSFTVAGWSGLVFFGGYGAYNLNNVLFLRNAWEYGVLEAGLIAMAGPATVSALSPVGGRLAQRFGFRLPAVGGALVMTAGAVAMATSFDETRRPGLFILYVVIIGAGLSAFITTNGAAAVAELPAERLSVGGAAGNALRQVGAAFGVAMLVTVVGIPVTTADFADAHSNGYMLVTALMLTAAVMSTAQTGSRSREAHRPRSVTKSA